MAKSPQTPKPAAAQAPKTAETAANATAATATETATQEAREQAAAEAKARETEDAAAAKDLAVDQREDVLKGGTGELEGDEAKALAKRHSVSDPKAAPVDYAVQTARKPAQRLVNPEETDGSAMPRAPIATLPYGSEPRSFDPATGLAPVPEAQAPEDVHGDDQDADTDRGSSAALREASAT